MSYKNALNEANKNGCGRRFFIEQRETSGVRYVRKTAENRKDAKNDEYGM
jgi:hypothetical protein